MEGGNEAGEKRENRRKEGGSKEGRKDVREGGKLIALFSGTCPLNIVFTQYAHLLGTLQGTRLSGQTTREMLILHEEQLWENVILAVGVCWLRASLSGQWSGRGGSSGSVASCPWGFIKRLSGP